MSKWSFHRYHCGGHLRTHIQIKINKTSNCNYIWRSDLWCWYFMSKMCDFLLTPWNARLHFSCHTCWSYIFLCPRARQQIEDSIANKRLANPPLSIQYTSTSWKFSATSGIFIFGLEMIIKCMQIINNRYANC